MRRALVAVAAVAAVAFSSCKAPAPPPLPEPSAPIPSSFGSFAPETNSARVLGGSAQRFLADTDVPGDWWTLFHSAKIDALVSQALAANPDVAAAQAALRSARETYEAQRSSAYPNAQGSFGVSRQQLPTFYAPPLTGNSEYVYGVHTASLDVAYTPDVFGNLRYQTAASAAAEDAQRFGLEATYLTLTTNVVAAALQAASLRDQIEVTRRIVADDRALLGLARAGRRDAQNGGLDVLNAESTLRLAEEALPGLERSLEQTNDLLARLVGRAPDAAPDADLGLADVRLPVALPLSLPSKLVEQRPDVAAASANLAQAAAQVGVAYTNRLPNVSITAQTATQALRLLGLFGPGSFLSTLTAAVSTTFYDHGTLKHREAAAVAAYDQAAAQYEGAVLGAFQNVADGIVALDADADALATAARADDAARRASSIVVAQYRDAQVSAVAVLTARVAREQADLTLSQARAARYSDTVAFFAALGGGWWNRNDVPPAAAGGAGSSTPRS